MLDRGVDRLANFGHSGLTVRRWTFKWEVAVELLKRSWPLVIGSVAAHHYSLMGAGWPPEMIEPTCDELATTLRADEVTAVCLVPV